MATRGIGAKITRLAAALAATAAAGSAIAADLPARKEAPAYVAPAPIFAWTGFYVGLNGGYTWSDRNNVAIPATDTGAGGLGAVQLLGLIPFNVGLKTEGGIAGGQIGYNWQTGPAVLGVEADIQGVFGANKSLSNPIPAISQLYSRKTEWLGTLRGRVGFTIAPTFLLYATGGLAYGGTRLAYTLSAPAAAPPLFATTTSSRTSVGWTAGVGAEYAFSNAWSVKVEWLYYDLGRQATTPIVYAYGGNISSAGLTTRNSGHVVRAGLNYRFGWGGAAPVLAKY